MGLSKNQYPRQSGTLLKTLAARSMLPVSKLEDAALGKMVQKECPVRESPGPFVTLCDDAHPSPEPAHH